MTTWLRMCNKLRLQEQSSDDSEVCRGIGHSIDELADASTGNGDASGRDGRDRHSPRYDESDDSRQEEAGERSQVEQTAQ